MPKPGGAARKEDYGRRLVQALNTHDQIFLVHADFVGSLQMQEIRQALRGKAEVLMGKNTMIRRVIRDEFKGKPQERLLNLMKGNLGFVFCTGGDMAEVRKIVLANKVPAAAKAGAIAPIDVEAPAGPTGLEPGMTSFFQALGLATKINRGVIEILTAKRVITAGEKVGPSEATLLQKLNIKPFAYGLVMHHVYDAGVVYSPSVLDMGAEEITAMFLEGVRNIVGLSLALGIPNMGSVPHMVGRAYQNLIAVSVETDYDFEGSALIKEMIKNPGAFASSAPAAGGGGGGAAAAAKAPEPEESEDEEMGLDLFG